MATLKLHPCILLRLTHAMKEAPSSLHPVSLSHPLAVQVDEATRDALQHNSATPIPAQAPVLFASTTLGHIIVYGHCEVTARHVLQRAHCLAQHTHTPLRT